MTFAADAITLAKHDLGLVGSAAESADAYLTALEASAEMEIAREGIVLTTEESEAVTAAMVTDDAVTVGMYVAYMYRKRAVSPTTSYQAEMPRMLRYRLNNRLMAQKAADDVSG